MSETDSKKILIGDRLSDATRKERRSLLLLSTISIIMIKANIIPIKITALGIEFSKIDTIKLFFILIIINVYFCVTFIVYISSDLIIFKTDYHQSKIIQTKFSRVVSSPKIKSYENLIKIFRIIIDFIVPILIAIYAITILVLAILS